MLGDLSPDQARFVSGVAGSTGLDPTVVASWVGAESGWGVTKPGGNYLNIGPGHTYASTDQAAAATAELIGSSDYYAGIRNAVPAGPAAQVKAIEASPWDKNHYGGGGLGQVWSELYSAGGPTVSADNGITATLTKSSAVGNAAKGAFTGALNLVAPGVGDLGAGVVGSVVGSLGATAAEKATSAVLQAVGPLLLQVVFVAGGIALVVLGLSRLTGTSVQTNYEHGKTIVGIVGKAADLAAV